MWQYERSPGELVDVMYLYLSPYHTFCQSLE